MIKKQNLTKRLAISGAIWGLGMFGALSFPGEVEKTTEGKEKNKSETLAMIIKSVAIPERRTVFLGDSTVIYNEYSFVDTSLGQQITFLSPLELNLKPIIEIYNLKTEDFFYDYGLNGFEGELEDGFFFQEKGFILSMENLKKAYEEELQRALPFLDSIQKKSM